MKKKRGIFCLAAFVIWTILVCTVDVQSIGPNGTAVGFASLNGSFHRMTGVNMAIYDLTDWLGLVPILVCAIFAGVGLCQWIRRRNITKVDCDILLLGIYYAVVIGCYLVFEMVPVNYRPVLIEGRLEASYPSSTTLLVLSVMPTLWFQAKRRVNKAVIREFIRVFTIVFSGGMAAGRLLSGVHWFTDIVGAVLLSAGLYYSYETIVEAVCEKK